MTLFRLLTIIFIIVFSYAAAIFFTKKRARIYLITAITLLWVSLAALNFLYFTNSSYRLSVDLKFNQSSKHINLSSPHKPSLVLPEKTALAYRYADDGAAYFTVQPYNEIVKFYTQTSDKNSLNLAKDSDTQNTTLVLKYKNCNYTIKIKKGQDREGYYLYIDAK